MEILLHMTFNLVQNEDNYKNADRNNKEKIPSVYILLCG
jgi:hypothetical protein